MPDGSNMAEGKAVIITGLAPVASVCQPVCMCMCLFCCVDTCMCLCVSERVCRCVCGCVCVFCKVNGSRREMMGDGELQTVT